MSDKAIALLATFVLVVAMGVWGLVSHICCGFTQRRRVRRADARKLSSMR